MRDFIDGTSNTILMSEAVRGLTLEPGATTLPTHRAIHHHHGPGPHRESGSLPVAGLERFYNNGLQVKGYRGRQMWDGQAGRLHTILPRTRPRARRERER